MNPNRHTIPIDVDREQFQFEIIEIGLPNLKPRLWRTGLLRWVWRDAAYPGRKSKRSVNFSNLSFERS
jgi:hypothetical protein